MRKHCYALYCLCFTQVNTYVIHACKTVKYTLQVCMCLCTHGYVLMALAVATIALATEECHVP